VEKLITCCDIYQLVTCNQLVCWKVVFFWKVNFGKVNYFLMFGSVMENKLENTFQCLVMIMENELENNLLMFYFSQVY